MSTRRRVAQPDTGPMVSVNPGVQPARIKGGKIHPSNITLFVDCVDSFKRLANQVLAPKRESEEPCAPSEQKINLGVLQADIGYTMGC